MEIEDLKLITFFKWAWKKKPTYCECGCKERLPKEINSCCMDHLLEKSEFPECKYSISNLFFCMPNCHTNKTNGHPNKYHKSRIIEALGKYDFLVEESKKWERKFEKLIKL